jgi:hypothetical protein
MQAELIVTRHLAESYKAGHAEISAVFHEGK